jgi:kynurenine--oxoglutarate transaminase/cysteine-S-conjugate beta-lyase/glutamine--phenylpyruvate transaminase
LSKETDPYLDYKFAKWFAKEWKVLGIPPSAFYSEEHKKESEYLIRFCFYKKEETLAEADKLLQAWTKANL